MQTNAVEKGPTMESSNVVEMVAPLKQEVQENVAEEIVRYHKVFPVVHRAIVCGNVALVGPAGCGKTTLAEQISVKLGVRFFFTGAINSEYKLTGFIDAQGRTVRTVFREAYEHGGLFLFDEVDASLPGAVLSFNSALANGYMDFPDACVPKHKDFYAIAAANTYWNGATREYVGRNQLDGATLDRFAFITMDYDEEMEKLISSDQTWVNYVQRVRKEVRRLKLRHIVSPRASIMGSKLLEAGSSEAETCRLSLWKGLDQTQVDKIVHEVGKFKKGTAKDSIPVVDLDPSSVLKNNELLARQVEFLNENPGIVRQAEITPTEEKIKIFRMWLHKADKEGKPRFKAAPASSTFRMLSWDLRKNANGKFSLHTTENPTDREGNFGAAIEIELNVSV